MGLHSRKRQDDELQHTLSSFSRCYRPVQQKKPPQEQLPQIPFHGLRHTSATLLIANHQDLKTVSKRLGHAQTSTTMNIYAHALQQGDKQAANALETMLKPKS